MNRKMISLGLLAFGLCFLCSSCQTMEGSPLLFGEKVDEYARTQSMRALDDVSDAIGKYCQGQDEVSLMKKDCALFFYEPEKILKMPFFRKGFQLHDRYFRILTKEFERCISGEQAFFFDSSLSQQVWLDLNRDGFFNDGDSTINVICIQTPFRSDTVSAGKER